MDITSVNNQHIKELKKLFKTKDRRKTGTFLVEGQHLVQEALQSNHEVIEILAVLNQQEDFIESLETDVELTWISDNVSKALSQTEQSQNVFALVKMKAGLDINLSTSKSLVLLDGVQDPGNLGTIIRTADAFGLDGVVLGTGTVDPYNAKVLRSGQGSHFHLPIISADLADYIPSLQQADFEVFGSVLDENAKTLDEISFVNQKVAIVLGNEGAGVSQKVIDKINRTLYIPMTGEAESLNVAIAGAIIFYKIQKNKT